MKFIISIVVVLVCGVAGYFLHPLIYDAIENRKPKDTILVVNQTVTIDEGTSEGTTTSTVQEKPMSEAEKLAAKLAGKLPSLPPPSDTPKASSGSRDTPVVEDEYSRKFPLPKFKPLEEITKNWTYIPSSVFPRKVKSKAPVEFVLAAGKATVPAGSELLAKGMPSSMVIVSRSDTDTLEAQVPLASTDLREIVEGLYEKYKDRATSRVLKQREAAKYAAEHPAPPPPPEDQQSAMAGAKPTSGDEGQVPELVASIRAGEVTEFKLSDVIRWGKPEFQMDGSRGYWTCNIVVRFHTIFGEVESEITAYVANGKVSKWIYTGSREPVQ